MRLTGASTSPKKKALCGQSCCLGCFVLVAPIVALALWSNHQIVSEKREDEAIAQALRNTTSNLQSQDRALVTRLGFIHFSGPKNGYYVYVSPAWESLSFQQRAEKTFRWYRTLDKPNMYICSENDDWYASVNDDGRVLLKSPSDGKTYTTNINHANGTWALH